MTETETQQHVAAIVAFRSTGELPKPCSDWKCGFCDVWYGSYPHDRREGYQNRLAALQAERAA